MCGIIYAKRAKNKAVATYVEAAYALQKSRGSEGFGFVAIRRDGTYFVSRKEQEEDILKELRKRGESEIIFHHRKPTSTNNYEFCAHPILVSNQTLTYDYLIVHNGVVSNPDTLQWKHEGMGFEYTTKHEHVHDVRVAGRVIHSTKREAYNDSEALAIEFALFLEGKIEEIDWSGTASIVAVKIDKHSNKVAEILWGHNTGNPLVEREIGVKKGNVAIIASAGGGNDIVEGVLYRKDFATNEITSEYVDLGKTYRSYRSSYSNYGFKDNSYKQTLLPYASDFEQDDAMEIINRKIQNAENELNVVEEELMLWKMELTGAIGSEKEAIEQEIRENEKKVRLLQYKISELYDDEMELISPYPYHNGYYN